MYINVYISVPLDQAAQRLILPGPEHCQGRDIHSFSGQLPLGNLGAVGALFFTPGRFHASLSSIWFPNRPVMPAFFSILQPRQGQEGEGTLFVVL